MNRLWNKAVRFALSRIHKTGLEQELNQADISGRLTVPEISEKARLLAAEGIVLLKNEGVPCPSGPTPGWRCLAAAPWTISPWATAAAAM